jgi:predicted nucleic acid-binding protein
MKVVDTNVLLYFYIPGDHTAAADALFKSDSEWIAPTLWRSEFRNILALYVRQTILRDVQALKISEEAELLMKDREFIVSSLAVLKLAFSSRLSAYDCEFVALAKQVNAPLVTLDQKLLTLFPADTLSLASFKTHS